MKPSSQIDQLWSSDLPNRQALARRQIGGYRAAHLCRFDTVRNVSPVTRRANRDAARSTGGGQDCGNGEESGQAKCFSLSQDDSMR